MLSNESFGVSKWVTSFIHSTNIFPKNEILIAKLQAHDDLIRGFTA